MPKYYLLREDGSYSDAQVFNSTPPDRQDGVWVEGEPTGLSAYQPVDVNKVLENAFLSVLPAHLGQPYLTPQVIASIASAKQSITDFNRLGLYPLSVAIIQSLDLPPEMEADKQSLLSLFPQ